MSEEKPPEQSQPPMDDYGIDHDRILEINEKLIVHIHTKYVLEGENLTSAHECYMISQTLNNIWKLTQDILNMDDMLTSAMGSIASMQEPDEDDNEDDFDDDDLPKDEEGL